MNIWILMLIAGFLTFLTRLSFIWLFNKIEVPVILRKALRFVPPAVLSVIIFLELIIRDSGVMISISNSRMWAGLVAVVIAWRTKNVLFTLAGGLAALMLLNFVIP